MNKNLAEAYDIAKRMADRMYSGLDYKPPPAPVVSPPIIVNSPPPPVAIDPNASTEALLERAALFLEDEEWYKADAYFERVLDSSPKCASAYIGKLCVELKLKKEEQLATSQYH
ncbi:MAG: hypothetical protein FWC89_07745 [Defluviitaleaceae bacterium]|nr:hypothetical protein [Defluviitaleaceae bacterium]